MKFFRLTTVAMSCGGLLLLNACSSSGGDGSSSNNIASAKSAAITSISNTMDASIDSIDTVLNNSTATDVLFDTGVGSVSAASVLDQNISSQAKAMIQGLSSNENNSIMPLTSHMDDTSLTTEIEEQLSYLLDDGTVEGDVIVYRPNIDKICFEPELNDIDQTCSDFLQQVSVEQKVISDSEGTLTFKYDTHGPFVIGYASDSVYFETRLTELNNAITAIDDTNSTMFDTFAGAVRLTLNKLGEQHGSIMVSITQAIDISGVMDGHFNSVEIAATDNVFAVEANGLTNEASISFGLGAVSVVSAMEDFNDPTTMLPTAFNMGGLTGLFEFSSNNDNDVLIASDVGLGDSPMTLDINSAEALNVSMATMGFTVDGSQQTITLDNDLDISLFMQNVNAVFENFFTTDTTVDGQDTGIQGNLVMTAPTSTVFNDRGLPADNSSANSITEITQGGPYRVTGTGFFEGDVTVNQSECFTEPSEGNFPIVVVDCPLTIQ